MTIRGDSHTATVAGVVVPLTVGGVAFDSTQSPHVQGEITLADPPEALRDALDPRQSPPPRILITATDGEGESAVVRTMDLTVRSRTGERADATVILAVASDEALLDDYRALADDYRPLALAGSLVAVCDYVLEKVIPGAALATRPFVRLLPAWDATNYLLNPHAAVSSANWRAVNATLGWSSGTFDGVNGYVLASSATAAEYALWAQATTGIDSAPKSVRPGEMITGWAKMRQASGSTQGQVRLAWWNDSGVIIGYSSSDYVPIAVAQRAVVTGEAPQGAARVSLIVYFRATAAGSSAHADAAGLTDGEFDPGHFDGSNLGTADYTFTWSSLANASPSSRTKVSNAPDPEALVLRAGQSAMEFLAPLVQAAGYRLVCDEQRIWTLRDENYRADGSINIRHAVNLTSGHDVIDRDADEWCDAAVVQYTWRDRSGRDRTVTDSFGLVQAPTRVRLLERTSPYPGPGFAAYVVRRAQGRGRVVSASARANWATTVEQFAELVFEDAPTQTGRADRVVFDFARAEMTIDARTVDTPLGAIDLLAGTINALTGTIDTL